MKETTALERILQYFNDILLDINESISSENIDKDFIHCFISHLPVRGKNVGWPEEVYEISDKCLQKLYSYAKEHKIIQSYCSFEEFLKL